MPITMSMTNTRLSRKNSFNEIKFIIVFSCLILDRYTYLLQENIIILQFFYLMRATLVSPFGLALALLIYTNAVPKIYNVYLNEKLFKSKLDEVD